MTLFLTTPPIGYSSSDGLTTTYADLTVINLAIDLIDDKPITALVGDTANTKVGRFMLRNFPHVRDLVLQRFPWTFAKTRVQVTADVSAPSFGWDYQYTLPSDCLRVLPLRTDGDWNGDPIPYEVEGRKLLTDDEGPIDLIYIKRVGDGSLFEPLFVEVVAATLAVRAAMNITGKGSYLGKAKEALQTAEAQAFLTDTLTSGTPESQWRHDIVNVRGVGL